MQACHDAGRRVHGIHQIIAAIAIHIHGHGTQTDAIDAIASIDRSRQTGASAPNPPPARRAIHAQYRVQQVFAAICVPVDNDSSIGLHRHHAGGDPRPKAGGLRWVRKAKRPVTGYGRRRDEVFTTIAIQVRQQARIRLGIAGEIPGLLQAGHR